jgi:hypothetical protein
MKSSLPFGSDGPNFLEREMRENDGQEAASRLEIDEWKQNPRRKTTAVASSRSQTGVKRGQ